MTQFQHRFFITGKSQLGYIVAIKRIFAAFHTCAPGWADYNRAMLTTDDSSALPGITLVLGGARSGKSRHGERLVEASGLEPYYIATAQALDDEMRSRIDEHKVRRGERWQTLEEPLALTRTLHSVTAEGRALLVDCLTLWLTNLMVHERPIDAEIDGLVDSLEALHGSAVFVSNEVGQGVMPTNAMARAFIDHAGRLHQRLAEKADQVLFMTAGLAQQLKP